MVVVIFVSEGDTNMHDPKKMAAMLMSKLENIDLDKVKGLQIGIMFDKECEDEYEDEKEDSDEYHMMPDGSKMKGKEHPKEEESNDE